jgi:hypothetical protein
MGRIEAYKTLFTDLECIGWYSAILGGGKYGDEPSPADAVLNKKMKKFTENPLLLILNSESKECIEKQKLPFFLYE